MATQDVLDDIEQGELILLVDDGRPATGDHFRLSDVLRGIVTTRLDDARTLLGRQTLAAGSQAGAAQREGELYDTLKEELGEGYRYINGLPKDVATAAQKKEVLIQYGWERGKIGDFTHSRLEKLAGQVPIANAAIANATRHYPTGTITRIAAALTELKSVKVIAQNGTPTATDGEEVTDPFALLASANARVRFHYCAASDEREKTAQLARINFQPRRDAGEAQPAPKPESFAGPVTFDPAALTLTAPARPAHATSLRAYRQPKGGDPERCGVTVNGMTVSVTGIGPLVKGVRYDLWLVGANFQGEGPESGRVEFTAN